MAGLILLLHRNSFDALVLMGTTMPFLAEGLQRAESELSSYYPPGWGGQALSLFVWHLLNT